MTRTKLSKDMPSYAKDIKLNMETLFNQVDASGLTPTQFYGVSLSVAYTLGNPSIINFILDEMEDDLKASLENAAKLASTVMAMNNIYYRFVHLVSDRSFQSMPAQLRMNSMQNSGVPKEDFELFSLAVSAINGCGLCIDSHVKALQNNGMDNHAIQTSIRIASVLNAAHQALRIESLHT